MAALLAPTLSAPASQRSSSNEVAPDGGRRALRSLVVRMPIVVLRSWPRSTARGCARGELMALNSRIAVAPREAMMRGLVLVLVLALALVLLMAWSESEGGEEEDGRGGKKRNINVISEIDINAPRKAESAVRLVERGELGMEEGGR
jgi:hypothetical protein